MSVGLRVLQLRALVMLHQEEGVTSSLSFLLFLNLVILPKWSEKSLMTTKAWQLQRAALLYSLKCCKVIADMETWMAFFFPEWLRLGVQDGVLADPMKAAIVLG